MENKRGLKHWLKVFKVNTLSQLVFISTVIMITAMLSNFDELFDYTYPIMVVACIILAFYVLYYTIGAIVNIFNDFKND